MSTTRDIIEIDAERCDGCGLCVLNCAENAIAIVDGKARIISDAYCDGLGACLQSCPQDALRIIRREAAPYDEAMVHALQHQNAARCPGSMAQSLHRQNAPNGHEKLNVPGGPGSQGASAAFAFTGHGMAHWPVKLRLMSADAPFLQGSHIVLTADCVPVASRHFHGWAEGKVVLTICPKFEDTDALLQKLQAIVLHKKPASIEALRMEVPCCQGLAHLAASAAGQGPDAVPLRVRVVGRTGEEIKQ